MNQKNNPWISGSFYLFAFIVIVVAFSVLTKSVGWISLAIVIIVGFLTFGIIGAFQLRNDEKLSEINFLILIFRTYKELPLLKSLFKKYDGTKLD